jgi:hypothetical protein
MHVAAHGVKSIFTGNAHTESCNKVTSFTPTVRHLSAPYCYTPISRPSTAELQSRILAMVLNPKQQGELRLLSYIIDCSLALHPPTLLTSTRSGIAIPRVTHPPTGATRQILTIQAYRHCFPRPNPYQLSKPLTQHASRNGAMLILSCPT